MASKYYDPDAILTEAQKAPCTFELTVPELSALNAGSTVEVGTKLDLPLWLAEMLAMSKPAGPSSSLASMDVPSALGPKVMAALAAGPKSVDIRAQAQWFYGMGERILNLFDDEELADVLSKVCMAVRISRDVYHPDREISRPSENVHWRSQTRHRTPARWERAMSS